MLYNRKTYVLFVLVALLIVLAPFFILCFYAHPSADDFSFSYSGRYTSFIQGQIDEYMCWNGRYFSNILVVINPIRFHLNSIYQFVPLMMLCVLWLSLYSFIHAVLLHCWSACNKILVASLLLALYLHQLPIVSEGIYWYTGSVIYTIGCASTLYLISLFILYLRRKFIFGKKILHSCLIFLVLVASMGFNEVQTAIILVLTLFFIFLLILEKKRVPLICYAVLFISIICGLILVLAPGNHVRSQFFPQRQLFWHSVTFASAQCLRFAGTWLTSVPLLSSSLLYVVCFRRLSSRSEIIKKSFYLNRFTSGLLLVCPMFICFFAPYWSTGILGQHRTANVAYFFFLPMWFINLSVWYNRAESIISRLSSINKLWQYCLLWGIIILSLLVTKNGCYAWGDLYRGRAKQFDLQMTTRYKSLNIELDTIRLDAIKNPPYMLFVLDITNNPDHWQNHCYNLYFKTETKIVLKQGK